MTELSQGTWIVVADGEKALFLRNLTDHENPHLEVIRKEEEEDPPTREQGTDRPGRRSDGGPDQRSAMSETDWHKLQKERFAAELADMLYTEAHRDRFERLVLVAAPHVLGDLRDKLHQEVTSKVIAEIPKTITNEPVDQIERTVKAALEAQG